MVDTDRLYQDNAVYGRLIDLGLVSAENIRQLHPKTKVAHMESVYARLNTEPASYVPNKIIYCRRTKLTYCMPRPKWLQKSEKSGCSFPSNICPMP